MSNGTATEEQISFTFPTGPVCWGLLACISVGSYLYWRYLKRHASMFQYDAEREEARAGSWQPYDGDLLLVSPCTLCFKGKQMEKEYVDARMDNSQGLTIKIYLSATAFVCGIFPALLDWHVVAGPAWFPVIALLVNLVLSAVLVISCAWMRSIFKYLQVLWLVQQVSFTSLDLYWSLTRPPYPDEDLITGELSALTYAFSIALLVFSGVFRWWSALIWSGLIFVCSVVIWAVRGDFCIKTFCGTDNFYSLAPWLYCRFLYWVLCLIVAYELERRDRHLFRLRKELEQLGLYMGQMDMDACKQLLYDIGKAQEPVAILARLHVLVKNIEKYRPFLPPGIFASIEDQLDEAAAASTVSLSDSPSASWKGGPTPASTPTSEPALNGASIELQEGCAHIDGGAGHDKNIQLHRGLARRKGTMLMCRLETGLGLNMTLETSGAAFLHVVADAAAQCQGVVHYFGCDFVIVCWNFLGNHPKHQALACQCALQIQAQKQQEVRQVVVSGTCLSGIFGIDHMMTPVVQGALPHVGVRLLRLNKCLKSSIVITEMVHEAVQASFATIALDNVVPEGLSHSVKLYGLLRGPPFGALEDRVYKEGFSCLLQHKHDEAQAQFLEYCRHPDASSEVAVQARRLLKVARDVDAAARPFCRQDGWAPQAGDSEDLVLPESPLMHQRPEGAYVGTVRFDDEIEVLEAAIDALADPEALESPASLQEGLGPGAGGPEGHGLAVPSAGRRPSSGLPCGRREIQQHIQGQPFQSYNGEYWHISPALLGAGGFGAVYLRMSDAGMLVAIKKMPLAPSKAREMLHEIRVLSQYRNEHIVAYLGSAVLRLGPGSAGPDAPDDPTSMPNAVSEGAPGGTQPANELLIIMEYVPCGSLAQVLEKFGKFPTTSVRRYARDILRGLQYLHAEGVLHRDIKPQNTLLEASGLCKLADFGTAALLGGSEGAMSETGAVVGTAHYMAPELLKGGQATVGADIWAFGITCLQLLTGQLWMDATNVFAVLYALGTMEEAPEIPEDLPEEVQEFLRACLSIKPDERATALGLLNMPFLL